jgi:hypothetical protein
LSWFGDPTPGSTFGDPTPGSWFAGDAGFGFGIGEQAETRAAPRTAARSSRCFVVAGPDDWRPLDRDVTMA